MNTVLIVGIIQALFLLLFVVNKKGKRQADFMMMLVLTCSALNQLFFYLNFQVTIIIPNWILILGSGLALVDGPILFWYVRALIRPSPIETKTFIFHLIPYFLYISFFLWYDFFVEGREVLVFDGFVHLKGSFPFILQSYSLFFAISAIAYPLTCLYLLHQHKKNIHNHFSYDEEITLDWVRNLIVFTFVAFLVSFCAILIIVDWNWVEDPQLAFYLVSGINTLFVFFMAYFALKQTSIFGSKEMKRPAKQYQRSGLERNRSKEVLTQLDELMRSGQPWTNPKLKLQQLAETLEVSSNHLSQCINENKSLSFFEYVNQFRVEAFKSKVSRNQDDHLTLLGIAFDCGFNSKSSFNHIFKSMTGMTPSAFKKQIDREK